jgi:Trk K+ transport system NAD-binding subunit
MLMIKKLTILLGLMGGLLVCSVFVFHYGMSSPELSWLDALYFTAATMTTVGYGDISLKDAPAGVKIYGILLMAASVGLLAMTFGLITDYLIKMRLEQLLGPRRFRMRNHIVLCGLGHVGMRILEQLRKLGEAVVIIEKEEQNRFLDEVRALDVPVLIGDVRFPSTLERANVKEARSIIAATNDDLVNLEVALNARTVRPDIRVVLRMFDANLAHKIRSGFGIKTTFSTSALAAPAFALAAVDPAVVGSFYVGEDLLLILHLVVGRGSKLDGMPVGDLENQGGLSVLCHETAAGERRLHPPDSVRLAAEDKITLSCAADACTRIKAMNTADGKDGSKAE